jgi:hypothetical protein
MERHRFAAGWLIVIGVLGLHVLLEERLSGQEGFLDGLYLLENRKTSRVSSYDASGANTDWITIAPGETKTLADIRGAGVIRRFYMAPFALDRMRYRKLVLRIYWDEEEAPKKTLEKTPCVEVPLGDFFGCGLGTLRRFRSLVVNVNPGLSSADFDGIVSYLPMPFEKRARITLENDGDVQDFRLWYHFDIEHYPEGGLPPNAGRLHAQWRRAARPSVREGNPKNTTLGNATVKNTGEDNFVILDAAGQGSYVGLFLTVDNTAGGWYGEGDDMIFVDGVTWPPTYPGTGHEEIFNSGCCPETEFAGPFTGFYLIENLRGNFGGKNQMYRFYVNDPIRFQKSIRVTVEHGHANNFDNDYTSTAFWYQKDPHQPFPRMPKADARLPQWPDRVAEALAREANLESELAAVTKSGGARLSKEDAALYEDLRAARTRSFRALRYDDFLRRVSAFESLVRRYRRAGPD